jgi:pyruvate dehydrogenase E1 component alpha subunit
MDSRRKVRRKIMELYSVLDSEGNLLAEDTDLDDERLLSAYKNMVLTRILDSRMVSLQRQGRMGTYVSCSGQEATQIGAVLGLSGRDWLFPMYRDLGMIVQMGVETSEILNKLFGNAADASRGRDLPNVFGWKEKRIFSLAAPIASQVCPGVGFAIASRMQKDMLVVLSSFGDGATSSSEFHTSLNFAGVYKAPIVFVCENNQYAISVPVEKQTASTSIAVKAHAYGFEGIKVDGNDLLAVYKIVKDAVDKARRGGGPTLIECFTYRMGSHSTSDDWKKYRTDSEVQDWKRRDPIERVRVYLEKRRRLWSTEKEKVLREEVESKINSEIERAESLPMPEVESMFEDVFANKTWNLEEQREESKLN